MQFSEALSYAVLAGTSLYCRFQVSLHAHPLDIFAYAATGTTAIFTLYQSEFPNDTIETLKSWAEYLETFAYPCLVGYLWLTYGEDLSIAYAHPLVLLSLNVIGTEALNIHPSLTIALGYTINEASCVYISSLKQNMYAMAGTAVFFLTELALLFRDQIPLPPVESVNYGLSAVIVLFSLAFKNAKEVL